MDADSWQSFSWYLEGLIGDPPALVRVAVNSWPFRVGRRHDLSLCLASGGVSKEHAEIQRDGGRLSIRDLDSRNGTFVNGNRIACETPINPGDVLHFANVEFRLDFEAAADAGATMQVDKSQWVHALSNFDKLFEPGTARPHFQPIINLNDGRTLGYEVLARSTLDGFRNPKQMFDVATRLNKEAELSSLFRRQGVEIGRTLPGRANLFLNTHPAELGAPELSASLAELRDLAMDQRLTLEIHEAAITDLRSMRELRAALRDQNIDLAYDDFGAGQARLVNLIEVPPDFLKFDIGLVRDIHLASEPRRQTLLTLVRMAHDLGVAVLAEGIECKAEGEACRELGFDFAQGYHFGKPADASEFATVAV